jgi:hypothetical protein
MIKTITLEWLRSQDACEESIKAWHKETDHNTFATLNRLIDKNPKWGNWLICRLMNKKQSVQYAIFAAEQVIDIYEGKYPNDKRPRNAIEAAKAYLKNPSKKTKAYAFAAAYAAADAAAAAAYAYADADAYAERKKNQLQTANICREFLTAEAMKIIKEKYENVDQ